jgi:hypothetical protein
MMTGNRAPTGTTFGMNQLFALTALLVVGLVSSSVLYASGLDHTLDALAAGVLPFPLTYALWPLEVLLYVLIGWSVGGRSVRGALGGLLLGAVTRAALTCFVVLAIAASMHVSWHKAFTEIELELWVYHALALLCTLPALSFAYRRLLAAGLHRRNEQQLLTPTSRPKQFSFAGRDVAASGNVSIGPSHSGQPFDLLQPPEGFVPPQPADNVAGMVTISREVILSSLPQAASVLGEDHLVRVRLAHIVPQLRNATVWVVWQQLVVGSGTDIRDTRGESDIAVAPLANRWIRIPAEHYVSQVPREFFQSAPLPPGWLKLAAVPQEAQFDALAESGR